MTLAYKKEDDRERKKLRQKEENEKGMEQGGGVRGLVDIENVDK